MNDKKDLFHTIEKSRTFRNLCELFGLTSKKVLDIGCGHGHYLIHFGPGSIGITTAQEEVDFGEANSLSIQFGNAEDVTETLGNQTFEVFWANNLFEHLVSPHIFLMKLKKIANKDSLIILGVPVIPKIVSLVHLRWWRGMLASNHIIFFTEDTLGLTVERAGWSVESIRPFIFQNRILDAIVKPIAPHLYVIARNKADFKYPPKKVGEWKDDPKYDELLSITHQNVR